ncbi:MAG: sugar transferase [Anaerolineaceae bacterium]|nr:sugar transferase [Anaerolineaceae bacterium]
MVFRVLPRGVPLTKRLFDIVVSSLAILLLSPLILLIGILIWIVDGRPVIFKQERPGLYGDVFTMYKFRTMRNPKRRGRQMPPDKRISRLGMFLRTTSMDELPELFNVLFGEMSFVGPRPLLVKYLKLYNEEQYRRHDVLPGITGWAQINGRNVQTWQQRFDFDICYVDNWTFWLDMKVLLRTAMIVLKREGVSPTGSVIKEEFTGNERPPKEDREKQYSTRLRQADLHPPVGAHQHSHGKPIFARTKLAR